MKMHTTLPENDGVLVVLYQYMKCLPGI